VANSEQIYIVRIRAAGRGAVVEDVRRRERRHVADPAELGPLIMRWIERPLPAATKAGTDLKEDSK
jgi:hypothetical protein